MSRNTGTLIHAKTKLRFWMQTCACLEPGMLSTCSERLRTDSSLSSKNRWVHGLLQLPKFQKITARAKGRILGTKNHASNFQSQSFSITSGTTSLYQLYYTSFVIESFIATKQLSPCIPTLIYLSASKNPSEGSFIGTTCSSEAVGLVVGPSSSFHVHVHVL